MTTMSARSSARFEGPVVSADHPSLDDLVDRFAARLRAEPRRFGTVAGANPKPTRSLVERICRRGDGLRVAALDDGDVVGLARVDASGEVWIAVVPEHRGTGIGTAMAVELVRRARAVGYTGLVLRSSRRSRAAVALGRAMGFTVVDRGRGRIDLVLDLAVAGRSA